MARRNIMHSGTCSQCRSCRSGVMRSYLRLLHTSLAAALSTDCRRPIRRFVMPLSVILLFIINVYMWHSCWRSNLKGSDSGVIVDGENVKPSVLLLHQEGYPAHKTSHQNGDPISKISRRQPVNPGLPIGQALRVMDVGVLASEG